MKQPKTGPVGNGVVEGPSAMQWISFIGVMFGGVLNLIVGIKRYVDYKKAVNKGTNSQKDSSE
ncbi:hypothetical protein [Paenibacillus sp. PL91]|uniref:hypothetical protein n=1 Tax=Paenibacillus sp. PL91 TaxID=2729538 RepID=UPI001749AE1E|nr:hypothetical protein [Paenibacillus sp. PL91]